MSGLQFVPVSAPVTNNEDARKVIRRHVMLGRNRGRTPKNPKAPKVVGATVFNPEKDLRPQQRHVPGVPSRVGSDLSLLEFADEVQMSLKQVTVRFCTTMDANLFTLEPCVQLDSGDSDTMCIQPLLADALHLNIMVFGAQVCVDGSLQQSTSQTRSSNARHGLRHYGKALRLLSARLPHLDEHPSMFDAVILAVYTLAMHALIMGDLKFAKRHCLELSRIVNLTPGILQVLKSRPKQTMELMRCDLAVSLATGEAPALNPDAGVDASRMPLMIPSNEGGDKPLTVRDPQLSHIWETLKSFCDLANDSVANSSKLPESVLLDTMASVMYELIRLSYAPHSMHELFRLTLLTISSKLFVQWPMLRLPLPWLQSQYEDLIHHMMQSAAVEANTDMVLWILITYGIAFSPLNERESGLLQQWLALGRSIRKVGSLENLKQAMKSFVWIDVVCDPVAEKLLGRFKRY